MKNKNKRAWVLLLMLLLIIVIVVWFISIRSNMQDDGQITIGFCIDNLVIERWQRDQEIFRAKAAEEGVEVIVYNAYENNETQNQQIRQLIKENVDVIVVIPYDKDGISEAISEAKKAGIKVIAYDRLISNAQVDAYISFDNVKVGRLQAASLTKVQPRGNYVVISGSEDDNNSYMFQEGYMSILEPYIVSGDIEIIEHTWASGWREEPAYETVVRALDSGKEIDAIIAANDRLAEAAIRALAEKGLAGEVYVAGHDADISACQRIVEGTQYSTIYKPIRELAEEAVMLAIKLARDEAFEADEKISNGLVDVPYIKLDVLEVTEDTMEATVIADGFHLKEDIYRNTEDEEVAN